MPIQADLQKTVDFLRTNGAATMGALSPDVQKDWNLGLGLQMYNLYPAALTLVPQVTPLNNMTPRVGGKGKNAEFVAITSLDQSGASIWGAESTAAATVTPTVNHLYATYKTLSLAAPVTFEAQWAGRGFTDERSLAVASLLRAFKIKEEDAILYGQNTVGAANQQAPGAVGAAPNLGAPQVVTSASGGAIPAGTYYLVQTAITGMGESLPSAASYSTGSLSGATSSVTVKPNRPAGQPVLGFNIYIGSASNGPFYLVGSANVSGGALASDNFTTNGQSITITSIPGAGTQPPGADGSASVRAYNGLLAQIYGGTGATITHADGALAVNTLNTHFRKMWVNGKADPDVMFCESMESTKITNITLGNGTPYFVRVDEQNGATAGFRVARFTNPVTGTEVPVRVHPTLKQGTIMTLSTQLPGWYVPTEDIQNIWVVDAAQDYIEIDYPPTANNRSWTSEIDVYGTLKLFMPLVQGVIDGVANT